MIEAALERGQEIPDVFREEPPLYPGEEFYLQAFNSLSKDRQIGMSIGPIPWSSVILYIDKKGLDPELHEVFEATIFAMDDAYIEWKSKHSG